MRYYFSYGRCAQEVYLRDALRDVGIVDVEFTGVGYLQDYSVQKLPGWLRQYDIHSTLVTSPGDIVRGFVVKIPVYYEIAVNIWKRYPIFREKMTVEINSKQEILSCVTYKLAPRLADTLEEIGKDI